MKTVVVLSTALATLLAMSGCGNQMLRQSSHGPLSSPRAAPPVDAIPASADAWDAPPSSSAAFGSTGPSLPEPNLPPANLSDNARNQQTPHEVDRLECPLKPDSEVVETGHTVFLSRCTQCHSENGHGTGQVGGYLIPAPVDLRSTPVKHRTDGALFWSISMGQGKMPGFRNWTTPYQRWALVKFIRTMPTARAATPTYPLYGDPDFERGKPNAQ